ncbi:MAG TPA: DUF4845 domain-containing protein [Leucothrix mucor]|nr:DUF4845 domain-containing protein [Leucothrix mucor]
MKASRRKQKGLTLISWMIVAALGILMMSAVIKVGPSYIEFNSVRSMMDSIAAEPGIKTKSSKYVYGQINKYLNINGLYTLEKMAKKKPFKLSLMKKGNNRKRLRVNYEVRTPWIGNISYLLDFKYAVILGEKSK